MAGRSVLGCCSQVFRRAQRTLLPRFSDPPTVQESVSQFDGCCCDESPQVFQFGNSDVGGAFEKIVTGTRSPRFFPNMFSTSVVFGEAVYRSRLSSSPGRGALSSLATSSSQAVSYSSSALEIEEDQTVQLASEIGYEVLGQYTPAGPRINPQPAFAVVQVGSHQFKVSPGDMIYTEKLKYADINDKLLLNKVLLMGSLKQTIIGRPIVPEAGVLAVVEELALDEKVIIFKKKRRKNYRRTRGHRQELTRLRILHIEGIEAPASAGDNDVHLVEGPV